MLTYLSQLGLRLTTERTVATGVGGRLEATEEIGLKVLAKLTLHQSGNYQRDWTEKSIPVGRELTIFDLSPRL